MSLSELLLMKRYTSPRVRRARASAGASPEAQQNLQAHALQDDPIKLFRHPPGNVI